MGIRTAIQWCDSTCNVVMGCSGCEIGPGCFARQLCQRFAGKNPGFPADFSKPELFLHRLADLRKWLDLRGKTRPAVKDSKGRVVIPAKPWFDGLPRLVFLSDLGEMFDPQLPPEWLARRWRDDRRQTVLEYLASLPHICVILTKQARRMAEFFEKFPCPDNVWPGVSVTNQKSADERLPWLVKCQTRVRIVSHEPAWGPIEYGDRLKGIAQLISGGQSGPGAARCDLAWLRSDRDQARAASCCFFAKQLGRRAYEVDDGYIGYMQTKYPTEDRAGANPEEWPEDLQNCREVPRC